MIHDPVTDLTGAQRALAELLNSAAARAAYARAPEAFAARFGLSESERAQVRALSATAVASYTATLARRRRREASRLLPATRAALGEAFDTTFEGWALRSPAARGRRRQAKDATLFCRFLLARTALPAAARLAAMWDLATAFATPARPWRHGGA